MTQPCGMCVPGTRRSLWPALLVAPLSRQETVNCWGGGGGGGGGGGSLAEIHYHVLVPENSGAIQWFWLFELMSGSS